MLPFIIFYIIVFLLSFKISKGKFTFWDFLLLLIIILFSALRTVGVDYGLYNTMFNKISPNINYITNRTGIGYVYFAFFVKNILHLNFQFIIIIFSTFTNLFIYLFLKKYSNKPGLALLIYISFGFYSTSFNMFRQMLSFSLTIYGASLLEEKKYLKTMIFYIIALTIHSSSIIGIVSYTILFCNKNIKLKPVFLFFISIILLLEYSTIYPLVIGLIDNYSMYLTYDYNPGIGTYVIVTIYLIMYLLLFYANRKKIFYMDTNSNLFYNMITIGTAIMLLEYKNFLFFRVAYYFTFVISITLVDIYEKYFKKNKIINLLFYLFMFIYFLIYIYSFDGVVPYKCILF